MHSVLYHSFCYLFFEERYKQIKTAPKINIEQNFNNTHSYSNTMESQYHSEELLKHCRVCGGSMVKQRVSYNTIEKADLLYKTHGIDTRGDQPDVHPTRFCIKCHASMLRYTLTTSVISFKWTPHSDPECRVRL